MQTHASVIVVALLCFGMTFNIYLHAYVSETREEEKIAFYTAGNGQSRHISKVRSEPVVNDKHVCVHVPGMLCARTGCLTFNARLLESKEQQTSS